MKINMSLCQAPFNLLSLINIFFFVLKVKQSRGIILTRYKSIVGLITLEQSTVKQAEIFNILVLAC